MFWKKEKPVPIAAPATLPQQRLPPTPEASIAEAILAYQRSFSESLEQVERAEVKDAQRLVARASQIIGESGLGPALVPTLLEHIKYWPTWSNRDDFGQYVQFPATNISGEVGSRLDGKPAVSKIHFTYNDHDYCVTFTDEGMSSWGDSSDAYGKVELAYQGYCVLGLDITQDLSKSYSVWRWQSVFAFVPGTWMKELTEMAAYIEAAQSQRLKDFTEKDALERARQIKL